jgi:hypothetical protein
VSLPSEPPFPASSRGDRRASAPAWLRLLLVGALLGFVPGGGPGHARAAEGDAAPGEAEAQSREYQIKAAFLLNFLRYTTWPAECFPDEKAPIVLTVVGRDPFGSILEETFAGEEVVGRRVSVARSRELPDSPGGHVLFCSELTPAQRAKLLAAVRGRPLLVVGETPGFATEGAGINFYIEDKKTRFEVNTDAVAEARLVLSPAVLKLARIVRRPREDER